MPAQKVKVLKVWQGLEGVQGFSQVGFDLSAELVYAPVFHEVFHPGVATLAAIAIVPLRSDDRLHQVVNIIFFDIANGIC